MSNGSIRATAVGDRCDEISARPTQYVSANSLLLRDRGVAGRHEAPCRTAAMLLAMTRELKPSAARSRRHYATHKEQRRAYSAKRYATDPVYRAKMLQHSRDQYATGVTKDPEHRAKRAARMRAYNAGGVREAAIESYLIAEVELRAGFCPKFSDPARKGAPDRLVLLRGHPTYFVELKRPLNARFESGQQRYHEKIRECGQSVWVLRTIEEVDSFFNEIDHA